MKDEDKPKEQLINEMVEMRQRITGLASPKTERKKLEERNGEGVYFHGAAATELTKGTEKQVSREDARGKGREKWLNQPFICS